MSDRSIHCERMKASCTHMHAMLDDVPTKHACTRHVLLSRSHALHPSGGTSTACAYSVPVCAHSNKSQTTNTMDPHTGHPRADSVHYHTLQTVCGAICGPGCRHAHYHASKVCLQRYIYHSYILPGQQQVALREAKLFPTEDVCPTHDMCVCMQTLIATSYCNMTFSRLQYPFKHSTCLRQHCYYSMQ